MTFKLWGFEYVGAPGLQPTQSSSKSGPTPNESEDGKLSDDDNVHFNNY